MRSTDKATISGTRMTDDGYLIADAFVVRTGIQIYGGNELELTHNDDVRVYRPEDEVCSPASLASFSHAPITMGHPKDGVTADTWKDLAIGEVSTEAVWDGNKIKLPLIFKDAGAIDEIQGGVRELSAGYLCKLDFTPGITPDGEHFDAKQTDIRINHVAVVGNGRAGYECRVGDNADGGTPRKSWGVAPLFDVKPKEGNMPDKMKTVVLGDKAVTIPADQAPAIEKFLDEQNTMLSDAVAGLAQILESAISAMVSKDKSRADVVSEMATAAGISDSTVNQILNGSIKDPPNRRLSGFADVLGIPLSRISDAAASLLSKHIAKKDAEIEAFKKDQLSDDDLHKKVQDMAEMVGKAALIDKDVKTAGLSIVDIRKAVVTAKLGDEAIKDKSDAYIEARFDVLCDDAKEGDPLDNKLKDGLKTSVTDISKLYDKRDADLADAWKPKKEA